MNLFYSWFSDPSEQSDLVRTCIESWKRFLVPMGFELKNLSYDYIEENNIKSPYLDRVIADKIWSHASDYLRFHSMLWYGGLYLDTDVMCYGSIEDLIQLDSYIGREGYKSSIPDEPEAAILWSKNSGDYRFSKLIRMYDELDVNAMTYKEIKLLTSPRMMLRSGMKVTSISHPNLIHLFNNSWFDYDLYVPDDIKLEGIDSRWNIVKELTKTTRYVITEKKQDFGEYKNLSIEEYGLDFIKNKLSTASVLYNK